MIEPSQLDPPLGRDNRRIGGPPRGLRPSMDLANREIESTHPLGRQYIKALRTCPATPGEGHTLVSRRPQARPGSARAAPGPEAREQLFGLCGDMVPMQLTRYDRRHPPASSGITGLQGRQWPAGRGTMDQLPALATLGPGAQTLATAPSAVDRPSGFFCTAAGPVALRTPPVSAFSRYCQEAVARPFRIAFTLA